MSLQGKVALVTGAGAGIGSGCALAFAVEGSRLALNDTSLKRLPLFENVDMVRLAANLFKRRQTERLIEKTISRMGGVDILVTGPASTVRKPALELEPEDYLKVYNDNFVSHVYLAKLVAQDMIRRKSGGRIIFISSIYGDETITRVGSCPYDAAKAALNKATRVLAKEWAKYGILVNAIAPGFTDTPGERKLATEEEIQEVVNKLPLGRAGTPQDIGEVAVMLASSKHITGQIITVAGGHDLVDLYDK